MSEGGPAAADTCPRCGGPFACGMADPTRPCPCTTVTLSEATLAALRQRYTGCLCLRCLGEAAAEVESPKGTRAG
ncbi:cysteine-rich CWC family protein [Aquabacterium sp.]|uniref:cysteine-rich CWC family protein n=1 Tax=Aquabacterium sp. TaxID=1872578 RepID=UPI003784BE7C